MKAGAGNSLVCDAGPNGKNTGISWKIPLTLGILLRTWRLGHTTKGKVILSQLVEGRTVSGSKRHPVEAQSTGFGCSLGVPATRRPPAYLGTKVCTLGDPGQEALPSKSLWGLT